MFVGLPQNILRHCVLHAIPLNDSLLRETDSITDPIAPINSSTDYQPVDFFSSVLTENSTSQQTTQNPLTGFLHSLIPPDQQVYFNFKSTYLY